MFSVFDRRVGVKSPLAVKCCAERHRRTTKMIEYGTIAYSQRAVISNINTSSIKDTLNARDPHTHAALRRARAELSLLASHVLKYKTLTRSTNNS